MAARRDLAAASSHDKKFTKQVHIIGEIVEENENSSFEEDPSSDYNQPVSSARDNVPGVAIPNSKALKSKDKAGNSSRPNESNEIKNNSYAKGKEIDDPLNKQIMN